MITYKTAEVAAIIGIHPNTVRLYEKMKLIPKPERLPNGYRIFTDFHIWQCKLIRIAFQVEVLQSVLHQKVTAVGNPLMLVQFRKQLRGIEEELKRLTTLEDADEELFTPIRTMLEILNAFAEERNYERRKKEKAQK